MRGVITSKRDGELTRYVKDPHGNVIAASKDNNVLDEYEYSAYGELLNGGAMSNPFRYCGEYYDTELDSVYLRNRYYTPSTGRFLTEDPIKDGMNCSFDLSLYLTSVRSVQNRFKSIETSKILKLPVQCRILLFEQAFYNYLLHVIV